MCYHSNKLNVHYLQYIGSQGPQITSSRRGKREKSPLHGSSCPVAPLGFYRPEEALYTETSASPGWSVEGDTATGESWHTCEGAGRGRDPSKQKCHEIKDNSI